MFFYNISGVLADEPEQANHERREQRRTIAKASADYNMPFHDNLIIFPVDINDEIGYLGAISREPLRVLDLARDYIDAIGLKMDKNTLGFEEVTLKHMAHMLQSADFNDLIRSDDDVLRAFGLDQLDSGRYRGVEYGENITDIYNKEEVYDQIAPYLVQDTMIPELDRIYSCPAKRLQMGHPVHYMVETDDHDTRNNIYQALFKALYVNSRVASRRYCFLDIKPGQNFSKAIYDKLYASCKGSAVVVRYYPNDDSEDEYASSSRETVEILCDTMKKYRNEVLTIFCLPRECSKTKELFFEHLENISIVEIKEEAVKVDRAKDFLTMLAKERRIRVNKKLFARLDENETYLAPDLHKFFDEWYNDKLKTNIFPQYKDVAVTKAQVIKAAPKGSAYDELMEMIGLDEAKKVINQALDYYKAQKIFADKGMKQDLPAMHMVFTGNPGTAKTTAARLFARIMKDNGLLSKGQCIEVGRGDLVGKYVGWTAPTIQKKFRDAMGSVLFIDEAYSLVDDRDGSFGDEAINTIVQEMENHREDVVVIFAGYPDKMEKFLKKNPGLRSRIAFHVPFEDYKTEDLCNIAKLIARKKGLVLTDEAVTKMSGIFEKERTNSDFGNGRYVRNVLEKAKMAQASRLLAMDFDSLGKKDIITICADDIEMPKEETRQNKKHIGFCA